MDFIPVDIFISHIVYILSAVKMPNGGEEMRCDQKELIVRLSEDGLSGLKVAELLKLNRPTELSGSVENNQRRGNQEKTGGRADRKVKR